MTACAGLKKDLERAAMLSRKVHNIAKQGMTGALQALGAAHFPQVAPNNWTTFRTLNVSMHANCKADSMRSMTDYNGYGKSLSSGCPTLKKEDTGALSEVGRELDDIPNYLARLQTLTEEALPENLSVSKNI